MTFFVGSSDDAGLFTVCTNILELCCGQVGPTPKTELATTPGAGGGKAAKIVRLPEHTTFDFQIFVGFLYTGRLFWDGPCSTRTPSETFVLLERLWIIGQSMLCTSFKDAIVDAAVFTTILTDRYPTKMYKNVYTYARQGSSMTKFLVDVALSQWPKNAISDLKHNTRYSRFFYDLALAMCDAKSYSQAREKDSINS